LRAPTAALGAPTGTRLAGALRGRGLANRGDVPGCRIRAPIGNVPGGPSPAEVPQLIRSETARLGDGVLRLGAEGNTGCVCVGGTTAALSPNHAIVQPRPRLASATLLTGAFPLDLNTSKVECAEDDGFAAYGDAGGVGTVDTAEAALLKVSESSTVVLRGLLPPTIPSLGGLDDG